MKKIKTFLVMVSLIFIIGSITQVKAKEKINLYLFYGDGCPHCEHAMEFFENIEDQYKEKFNLVKYETWYNQENGVLMEAVAKKLGVEAQGVPFMVIGDETLGGYSEEYNDQIRNLIVDAYESQTDVVKDIDLESKPETSDPLATSVDTSNPYIVYVSLIIILIGAVGLVFYAKKSVN